MKQRGIWLWLFSLAICMTLLLGGCTGTTGSYSDVSSTGDAGVSAEDASAGNGTHTTTGDAAVSGDETVGGTDGGNGADNGFELFDPPTSGTTKPQTSAGTTTTSTAPDGDSSVTTKPAENTTAGGTTKTIPFYENEDNWVDGQIPSRK